MAHLGSQRGGQALQHVLRQQHGLAPLVQGALGQAVDAAQRALARAFELIGPQRSVPQTLAFALAQLCPHGARIGAALRGDLLHRGCARVPLDQHIHLAVQTGRLGQAAFDQVLRGKARVSPQQQRCWGHPTGCAQRSLHVEFALSGTVSAACAQIKLQAVAACAQVQRDGAVALNPGVGPGHTFIGRVALIHHKGVDFQPQVAGVQGAEVDGRAVDAQTQQGAADLIGQFALFGAHGVKALAQGRARRHGAQAQRPVGKALRAEAFNHPEVVLAQGEQGQVALEDVAVGDAA